MLFFVATMLTQVHLNRMDTLVGKLIFIMLQEVTALASLPSSDVRQVKTPA